MPTVSILLPVRNGEPYLGSAIESVLAQTHQNWELVISENQSVDSSALTINRYRDPRIKVFSQARDLSMVENWDFALQKASGRYGLLLGSDDILLPDHISHRLELHKVFPQAEISGGPHVVINSAGEECGICAPRFKSYVSFGNMLPVLLNCNPLNILTVFFDLQSLKERKLHFCQDFLLADWRLWLDMLLMSGCMVFSERASVQYRVHQSSATSNTDAGRWAFEAAKVATDFLDRNSDALHGLGIKCDVAAKEATKNLWLASQKQLRAGKAGEAMSTWRLYRRWNSVFDLVWGLPCEARKALASRFYNKENRVS